jgi:transposase
LQQHSALVFLQTYPTLEAAQAASVEQIRQVLTSAGHTTAQKVAPRSSSTCISPACEPLPSRHARASRLALALIAQLLPLIEQITAYEKEIKQLFLSHEDNEVFASLPGAGKRLAPRLLAEIGDDPSRYASAASLQALGGTSPVLCAKWDLFQAASPPGLYQAAAQCASSVCLAKHPTRSLGQSLL